MKEATRQSLTKRETGEATYAPDSIELRELGALPTAQALPRAAAFLAGLVRDSWFLGSQVLAVLDEARGGEGWYVARRWDDPEGPIPCRCLSGRRGRTR